MKKVFLATGFLSFSVIVSAQQNDFFDPYTYLQRKSDRKIKLWGPGLKQLPLIPFAPPRKVITDLQNPYIDRKPGEMPCIKPDMNAFKAMPNNAERFNLSQLIAQQAKPGIIPNPPLSSATPIRIK